MDTFVDSSWYYLRYVDPKNESEPFSKEAAHKQMPVDLYIGGKEHAIMHLFYARFFHHFLHDLGLTPTREPFINLLTQGMVMGQSYKVTETGKYLAKGQVDFTGETPVEKSTGAALTVQWEKMSKSKYNGVEPQDILEKYGIDSTRLCIVAGVAPKSDRLWTEDVFKGVDRWQFRIWSLVTSLIESRNSANNQPENMADGDDIRVFEEEIFEARNFCLKEVNHNMESAFLLSTAISFLQSYTNKLKKVPAHVICESYEFERAIMELVIMISPFAPLIASEMWEGMRQMQNKQTAFSWEKGVLEQEWPKLDDNYRLKLRVQLNSKDAYTVPLEMPLQETESITKDYALKLAQSYGQEYNSMLQGYTPSLIKFHLVPGVKVELYITVNELDKKKKQKTRRKKDKFVKKEIS